MVLETEILPYLQWLSTSLVPFLTGLAGVAVLGILFGFLAAALRHGPAEAARMTTGMIGIGLRELVQISPRRLFAIARLAFQEAIRRRVLIVFAIFVIALMFGGWFLDRDSDHPAQVYLSFVLTATNYLVLLLAIFISAFSLPNEMKSKTIYTIVTKPVRGWEIVVGRMLGFSAIGTVLLAFMCLFSYFFVQRGLQHSHELDPATMTAVIGEDGNPTGTKRGQTSLSRRHVHQVEIDEQGNVRVDPIRDHTHRVTATPDDTRRNVYVLGDTQGLLLARVPILGELRFLDRSGRPGEGTNVGYEWAYRRYIEGGTFAAAIWRFRGLKPDNFGDSLPLEMSIRVFRTFKGNIEEGIKGTIELVKPAPLGPDGMPLPLKPTEQLRSVEMSFTAQEYKAYQPTIPRKIMARDGTGATREVDVFQDLIDPETGELEVWIRCLDNQQYFGMAQADLYLRAKNRPFWVNFIKGYTSIWFQMVVVTCFGVAFSTFLSGPVAMIATLGAMVVGFFKGFVVDVATGEMPGGGPLESTVRLIKQWNQMSELEPGIGTEIMKRIDSVLMLFVQGVSQAMPDCGQFNTANFVAHGFDIPFDLMAQHFTITLAYAMVVSVAGYFFLKTREIAA